MAYMNKMSSDRVGKCPRLDCKYKAVCGSDEPIEFCYEKGDLGLNKVILDAKQKVMSYE